MSAKHEYAICLLTETVNWFQDFTNDLDVLNKIIQGLQPQQNYTKLNMATLFETLDSKIKIPDTSKPPEVVYRVIFFCILDPLLFLILGLMIKQNSLWLK